MDLSEFRPKSIDWVGSVAPALKSWGVEEREANIIIDEVMRVVMDRFGFRLRIAQFHKDSGRVELKIIRNVSPLHIEIYQILNGVEVGFDYTSGFVMTNVAKLFFQTFAISFQSKRVVILKKKEGMTNDKLITLCSTLVPSKYPPPKYEAMKL